MRQLTATQLKEWLDDPAREKPVLVDVREPWEFDLCRLDGAKLLPLGSIPARFIELKRDAETVVICRRGSRSYQACMFLERQGFTKLFNLYGGMAAWAHDVDPTTPTY